MFLVTLAALQEPLSLERILADIPRDASAFFIYLFTAISLYLIWKGSRTRS